MMSMPRKTCRLGLLFILLISGCSGQKNTRPQKLTIYAASSLTDVFTELSIDFEAQNEVVKIQMQYAGSAQLAIQITQGAPVDIFASANQQQINIVDAEGLVEGEPLIFARNELVLIVPRDNPATIQSFQDIGQNELNIVTAVEGVPIRVYTDVLLNNLAEDNAYGSDFHNTFYANIRSEETNVRQVVLKTALGEADAAIVYRTDITAEVDEQLQVLEIPQVFSPSPVYFIAIINEGNQTKVAKDFVDYILSEAGQTTLKKYGFAGAGEVVAPTTDDVAS